MCLISYSFSATRYDTLGWKDTAAYDNVIIAIMFVHPFKLKHVWVTCASLSFQGKELIIGVGWLRKDQYV